MAIVDIADVDAALGKVRAFITLLEQNRTAAEQAGGFYDDPSPQLTQTDNQIQEQLPLIQQIASRVDAILVDKP